MEELKQLDYNNASLFSSHAYTTELLIYKHTKNTAYLEVLPW